MAYETKLIIGLHCPEMKGHENKNAEYVSIIAEINLCRCVFYDTFINKETDNTFVYIYGTDGNTEISKDKYGSQLRAINPSIVLKMMQDDNKKKPYRRYQAAIPMLKSLIKSFPINLTCILYGY